MSKTSKQMIADLVMDNNYTILKFLIENYNFIHIFNIKDKKDLIETISKYITLYSKCDLINTDIPIDYFTVAKTAIMEDNLTIIKCLPYEYIEDNIDALIEMSLDYDKPKILLYFLPDVVSRPIQILNVAVKEGRINIIKDFLKHSYINIEDVRNVLTKFYNPKVAKLLNESTVLGKRKSRENEILKESKRIKYNDEEMI